MRVKVAALAHLGRVDEARLELGRVLAIDPKLTSPAFVRTLTLWPRKLSNSTSPGYAWPAYRKNERRAGRAPPGGDIGG